jgi:hypothetical protein
MLLSLLKKSARREELKTGNQNPPQARAASQQIHHPLSSRTVNLPGAPAPQTHTPVLITADSSPYPCGETNTTEPCSGRKLRLLKRTAFPLTI